MLLRMNYDQYYGLFNHDDDFLATQHPLALVEMHEKEKVEPHTALYKLMERFVDYKVAEYTGMDFPTFIQQPRDVCDHWLKICKEKQAKAPKGIDSKTVRDLERQLGESG